MRLNREIIDLLKQYVFILMLIAIFGLRESNTNPAATDGFSENEVHISDPIRENLLLDHENRVRYAEKMKLYMNNTTDPCEDFYEYACGNWKSSVKKRYSSKKTNNLFDLSFKIQDAIENILTTPIVDGQYINELRMTQEIYQNCLSENLYPIQKSKVYLNVLNSIGGFPALEKNWQSANFSWFNMTSHLSKFGINTFVTEDILPEYPFQPLFELPDLERVTMFMGYIIDNNSEIVIDERKTMETILKAYEVEESKINKTIKDIFSFLDEIVLLPSKFDNDFEKCINMSEEMSANFSDWRNYMDIVWYGTDFENPRFGECPCDYLYTELDKICNQNKEAVVNYLALKFLYKMHANLETKEFQRDYCLTMIRHTLKFIVDYFYMQRYFNATLEEEVTPIMEKVRENLKITLENADWLDEETRKEALLKESTLKFQIGNFKDANVTDQIIHEINNLNISNTNFEENLVNLFQYSSKVNRYLGINHKYISNTTKPLELLLGAIVNAFYYNDNSIYVMAGVLNAPVYHSSWPVALKYGTIGFLVGHELSHSISSQYDSSGEMRNWWTEKIKSVYDERAKCFVDHFDSYLIPEIDVYVNGNRTMSENIADDIGLRQSLNAYRREHKLKLKESDDKSNKLNDERMPGLDLNPEQLFFLGFAQLWCSVYNEKDFWDELEDEHTIDRYRVLGALSNNEDFSQAFSCPVGSKMNPNKTKCRIF